MKSKKLKTLAVAVVLSLTIGAVLPVTGTEIPMITTTVEAAAKKVSLKASNKKVYAGKTVKINAKATRGAKLSYKTSNKKIATVNSKGVITGKSAGTAKITITAKKSKYKTVKKTITVKVVKQNQKITASNVTLTIGQRKNLGAKARTPMIYKSSKPKVVTVDKKGNLRALKTGTAKITISAKASGIYNKASKTIAVTVSKAVASKPITPTRKPEASKPTTTPGANKSTGTNEGSRTDESTRTDSYTRTNKSTGTDSDTDTYKNTGSNESTGTDSDTSANQGAGTNSYSDGNIKTGSILCNSPLY